MNNYIFKYIRFFCILIILVVNIIFLGSCWNKGCTDPNATNYDPDATKDDGSCSTEPKYATVTLFRYGDCFDGATDLYLDGTFQKSFTSYVSSYPSCGSNSYEAVTFSLILGVYHFTAYSDSNVSWDFYVDLSSENSCYSVALMCGGYAEGDGVYYPGKRGNLVIWSSFDFGDEIRVKINGAYRGRIRYFYDGTPGCGYSGCVTVSNLSPGIYSIDADNGTYSWDDYSVLVRENMCNTFELQ